MSDTAAQSLMAEKSVEDSQDLKLLWRLWPYVRRHKMLLVLGLLLIPVAVALELAQPIVLMAAINDHIRLGAIDGLGTLVLLYVALVALQSLASFAQYYAFQMLGQRSMHELRCHLYNHVTAQRRGFFDVRPIGRLLTRMTNDVETINEIFASGVITLVIDIFKMLAIVGTMLALDAKLTLMTFLTLPVLFFVVAYARRIMRTAFRTIRVKLAAMNAFVQEHLSGIKVVQLFQREARAEAEYNELNAGHRDAYLGSIRADATMYAVVEAIGVISTASIAWYAGSTIFETGVTIGLVVAFTEYVKKFFIPVRDFSAKYTVLQSAMAATERIVGLLDTDESDAPVDKQDPTRPRTSGDGSVVFEDVWFSYRPGEDVLRGCSLTVAKGQTVAVVGATGSGKSTIIRLLARLYEPRSGSIRLGGEELRSLQAAEVRRRLTMVSQDVHLFSGTVADNVRMGKADATDDEIRAALDRVGALKILEKRELSIDAEVRERGQNFSAGERQLIAFARALIRDPEILVLDEATAHVDPEAEELIECGLDELMAGRTTLVIAHRLSTIRKADQIVVVSRGQVAESGTHDELVAEGGIYARLERTFRQS